MLTDPFSPIDEADAIGGGGWVEPVCELGTVGWQGDDAIGDVGTDQNSGATYVKVTLAKGHPRGKPEADDGGANGHQIRCRLQTPCWFIPMRGAPCMVLYPSGMAEASGVALCIPIGGFETGKLPNAQPGEPILYGPVGQFLRMKLSGDIAALTTDDATPEGRSIYWRLSPDKGFEVVTPWGRITCGPEGIHLVHSSGARLDLMAVSGLVSPLDALGSSAGLSADTVSVEGTAVSLGTDAGATNATAVGVLLTWLAAHTHSGVTTGIGASGPPVVPPAGLGIEHIGKIV